MSIYNITEKIIKVVFDLKYIQLGKDSNIVDKQYGVHPVEVVYILKQLGDIYNINVVNIIARQNSSDSLIVSNLAKLIHNELN